MIRVATLASDPEREPLLAAALAERSDVELVLRCVDRVEALAAIRSGRVGALIGTGRPQWFDRQCRDEAASARVRVVFVEDTQSASEDWGSSLPLHADIDEIVLAARDSDPLQPPAVASDDRGRLISVWGPKGAPGRSRVAIELSCELATFLPTLLVDGDPYGGDVVQLLGILDESPTVIWASRMAVKGELDPIALELNMKRIGSAGPSVIPGLPRGELWPEVSSFGWRELLESVRASFGYVVIDVGFCLEPSEKMNGSDGGRNHMARQAVALSDHVVAVCSADPVGIKNFLWSFGDLLALRDPGDIVVALNRTRRGNDREAADLIRRHLGKRVAVFIPDRPSDVDAGVATGQAVKEVRPDSEMSAAIRALCVMFGMKSQPRGALTRLVQRSA